MAKNTRADLDDLRAASRLLVEGTTHATRVVEAMHRTIAAGPAVLGRPLEGPVSAVTALVYGAIRGVTAATGAGVDLALARLAPLLSERAPGPERAAMLAVLNGVVGDHLAETGSALALRMQLCYRGEPLALERGALATTLPSATSKVLVLVHGSCMNDLQWTREGHDHGAALAQALGYTPLYLRYNSGLHVSTNGRALAALLEELVDAWPIDGAKLVLLGHSMGGLVARSACGAAERAGHRWRRSLASLVCLGAPHHGAPLERGGSWIELLLGVSRYSAPIGQLGRLRSAGVTDLRYGNVLDEDWAGRDRFAHGGDPRTPLALPEGVRCYVLAGTKSLGPGPALRSDGLVPVDSALGRHADPARRLAFPDARCAVSHGTDHWGLLSRADVYATLRGWLSSPV